MAKILLLMMGGSLMFDRVLVTGADGFIILTLLSNCFRDLKLGLLFIQFSWLLWLA